MEYTIIAIVVIVIIGVIATKSKSKSKPKDDTVSIGNSIVQVRLNKSRYAGVVDSIVVHGQEWVNSHDHGRLFQTALQIDGYGECFNPTEAGSYKGSDSILEGITVDHINGNTASTTVRAASWGVAPDGLNYCPKGTHPGISVPTDTRISKKITVDGNIITWDVSINSPSAKERFNIEVLTGYLTANFNKTYYLNKNKALIEITDWKSLNSPTDGYPDGSTLEAQNYPKNLPIVFADEFGLKAMGVIRTSPVKSKEISEYHLLKFKLDEGVLPNSNSCSKFSVVSSGDVKILGNTPSFQVKLIVGSLNEVLTIMKSF